MGDLIRIDDFKLEQQRAKKQQKTGISEQYRIIGQTLETCETSSFRAGVPWLPPSPKRDKISKNYQGPLEDFIRSSLVAVSSETLEHYCEDLNSFTTENTDSLFLPVLYPGERFFFCLVVFLILFTISLAFGILLGSTKSATLVMSFITSIPAALLAAFPCLEIQRRSNFYYFLSKELSRRRGRNSPNSGNVVLSSS